MLTRHFHGSRSFVEARIDERDPALEHFPGDRLGLNRHGLPEPQPRQVLFVRVETNPELVEVGHSVHLAALPDVVALVHEFLDYDAGAR